MMQPMCLVFDIRDKVLEILEMHQCLVFMQLKSIIQLKAVQVCFHDKELGHELYKLRDFGIKDAETIDGVGSNAKINEFVAAMGLCNLPVM